MSVRVCVRARTIEGVGECLCVRVCKVVGARAQTCACERVALTSSTAHAPYYHMRPLWLYYIFRHYLISGAIFGKKVIERKICVLIFSTTFV